MHEQLTKLCKRIEPVGSRVTCSPAPTDTDEDFLCLVASGDFQDLINLLYESQYEIGGSDVEPSEDFIIGSQEGFQSYRKGITNLIVTCSQEFFDKFMDATNIAKSENLLLKQDRIDLFQHILYGNIKEFA